MRELTLEDRLFEDFGDLTEEEELDLRSMYGVIRKLFDSLTVKTISPKELDKIYLGRGEPSVTNDMQHLNYLAAVAEADVRHVLSREQTYRGSWKKSGGRSAWHMLRRKIDRLLVMMARPEPPAVGFNLQNVDDTADAVERAGFTGNDELCIANVRLPGTPHATAEIIRFLRASYVAEDVFAKIEEQPGGGDGTVLAEIRDLRQYLLLVESEMMARGVVDLVNLPDAPNVREQPGGEPMEDYPKLGQKKRTTLSSHPNLFQESLPRTDSNKHAIVQKCDHPRIEDGESGWWVTVESFDPVTRMVYSVADRRHYPTDCDHLPLLQIEMNEIEWRQTPPHYRGMYGRDDDAQKWVLGATYQENWGQQP